MKGVTFIKDETHNKRYVQIGIDQLEKYQNKVGDLQDVIMAQGKI